MKRKLFLISTMILVSCSGSGKGPPRNLDNACSMKSQRLGWFKEMDKAERKWGVPTAVLLAAIYQESKFNPEARTPYRYALGVIPMGRQSSAYGYSQALDATWGEYKRAEGGFGAKRNNFADAVDFMGWYMDASERRNGISKYDMYNQYLAYHDGHTGYARGTYRKKAWLMRIAGEVEARAIMYQNQLRTCP
ncbi:MAG: transglycosylase SLT domain-containing protein [Amylibacter sp.]|nr:transglycosylase SLT domain-containing protein [Amylibacter sp.]